MSAEGVLQGAAAMSMAALILAAGTEDHEVGPVIAEMQTWAVAQNATDAISDVRAALRLVRDRGSSR